VTEHKWLAPEQHLWGPWKYKVGLPKPIQYRQCLHPNCTEVEEREAPK